MRPGRPLRAPLQVLRGAREFHHAADGAPQPTADCSPSAGVAPRSPDGGGSHPPPPARPPQPLLPSSQIDQNLLGMGLALCSSVRFRPGLPDRPFRRDWVQEECGVDRTPVLSQEAVAGAVGIDQVRPHGERPSPTHLFPRELCLHFCSLSFQNSHPTARVSAPLVRKRSGRRKPCPRSGARARTARRGRARANSRLTCWLRTC